MKGVIIKLNRILEQDYGRQKRSWMLFSLMEFCRDISHLDFERDIYGRSHKSVMEFIAGKPLSGRQVQEYTKEREELYRILCREEKAHNILACGAEAFLNELKERRIPRLLVIETNQPEWDFYIEQFESCEWFSRDNTIFTDVIAPGVTDYKFYSRAINTINLPGKNCLAFEDTVPGIGAAKKAGIGKVIVIAPCNRQSVFESMQDVDDVIGNFNQFNRVLLNEL